MDRLTGSVGFGPPLALGSGAFNASPGGSQTFRHEIDITPAAAQALRDAGYDDNRVSRQIGEYVRRAVAGSHVRWDPA